MLTYSFWLVPRGSVVPQFPHRLTLIAMVVENLTIIFFLGGRTNAGKFSPLERERERERGRKYNRVLISGA